MHILVFGGTRFVGRSVVEGLVKRGHSVTTVSRRAAPEIDGITSIMCEREEAYDKLDGKHYDRVIDFMAYDQPTVKKTLELIGDTPYIFISSSWVSQLEDSNFDEISPVSASRSFYDYETRYVRRKLEAEELIFEHRRFSPSACVLRFPIIVGSLDHTERVWFYLSRLFQGAPQILIDGGVNLTQLAYKQDVVDAIILLLEQGSDYDDALYEGLPNEDISVRDFVIQLASSVVPAPKLVPVSREDLELGLVEYLNCEPFWRETSYRIRFPSLFQKVGCRPTPYKEWISKLSLSISAEYKGNKRYQYVLKDWQKPEFLQKENAFHEARSAN